jgi:hypothetical protein
MILKGCLFFKCYSFKKSSTYIKNREIKSKSISIIFAGQREKTSSTRKYSHSICFLFVDVDVPYHLNTFLEQNSRISHHLPNKHPLLCSYLFISIVWHSSFFSLSKYFFFLVQWRIFSKKMIQIHNFHISMPKKNPSPDFSLFSFYIILNSSSFWD